MIFILAIGALGGLVSAASAIGYSIGASKTQRIDRAKAEKLEEAERTLYELTVHDDMLPTLPEHLRARIDRQLGESNTQPRRK